MFKLIIQAFLVLTILSANAQQTSRMAKAIKSGLAPVNGIQMYYEVYPPNRQAGLPTAPSRSFGEARPVAGGEGAIPLVLIHGGGSTIQSTFGNILPILSKQHKIIAVELQAHGRTSDRDAPESFEQDADDVAALLTYLKIDKANFFGFSNGGTTSLQIGIRHPEIVNKLVVVSANSKREGMIPGFFESMESATLDNMPAKLKVAYSKVAPNKDNLIVMFTKDRDRMRNYKDIPDDALKSIKASTLLLGGDKDVVTPQHLVNMSQLIPNSRLAILPGDHGSFIGEICAVKDLKMIEMSASLITEFIVR